MNDDTMRPFHLLLAAGLGAAAPAGHWRFDGGLSAEGAPELAGCAGVFGRGAPPLFDANTPASNVWNGATYSLASPANTASLRFVNEPVAGAGSPAGGEVAVDGAAAGLRMADLTVEAFVKTDRQMPRHALIASKRRDGQTGASWSLSIDPEGRLRARFDTQAGAGAKGGAGFNQSFGSTGGVADGAWHHVALTFDHATRTAVLYLDHVRCGGGVAAGPLVYDDGPLVFGRGLDGWIDEVRLTPQVLHPEQFLRHERFFTEMKPRAPTVSMLDQTPTRVQSALKPDLKRIGTLSPGNIPEADMAIWSLGCETLDRDLADWHAYKAYLIPLGIRRIRLQGGWNRTEKTKGEYDFRWLDRTVDDAHARGLSVCLETSYNNRLYEPAGATGPGGRLPEGGETLAAWDRWVEAMARRYAPKGVSEWMMYNEPNLNKSNTLEKIVANNVRTAEIIKRVDPGARIGAFVLSGLRTDAIRTMLEMIRTQGKLDLFHWAVYHGYSGNPDRLNERMAEFNAMLAEVAPKIEPWQGEAGCASEEVQFALSGIDWTEYSQAKWNARRMLCDFGHGIESSVFTISDLSYHKDFISRYGLLKTGADNSILKVKTAYYTVQNVVRVFNGALERAPDLALTVEGTAKTATSFAFRDKRSGVAVVALWDGGEIPSNASDIETVRITISNGRLHQPVWLDLVTGNIYEIPADRVSVEGATATLRDVPMYDGPGVVTDRSLLAMVPARETKKAGRPQAAPAKPATGGAPLPMVPHLLPGTQQPAPAVLVCAEPGEDVGSLVRWLNAQEVHAFVVAGGEAGPADARRALQAIRSRSAEWQVRAGSTGVLGTGRHGVSVALAVIRDADFAVFLGADAAAAAADVAEAKRKTLFIGPREGFEETLAGWLGTFKGTVFPEGTRYGPARPDVARRGEPWERHGRRG